MESETSQADLPDLIPEDQYDITSDQNRLLLTVQYTELRVTVVDIFRRE